MHRSFWLSSRLHAIGHWFKALGCPRLLSVAVGVLIVIGVASHASAQQRAIHTDTIGVKVYFRKGYSLLQPGFRQNGDKLAQFLDRISALRDDSCARLMSIDIIAYASPDGSYEHNTRLARKRADRIFDYLHKNLPDIPASLFSVQPKGINWQGLAMMVEGSDMQCRDEVLDILQNVPEQTFREGRLVDSRMKHLMDLRGGRPYWYMFDNFFPALRNGGADVVCNIERPLSVQESDTAKAATAVGPQKPAEAMTDGAVTDTMADTVASEPQAQIQKKPFYMSLSTNMLYDALLIPNIGVEFWFGHNFSVTANWMYSWWSNNRRHRYWRIYGGDLALRWWFGRAAEIKPLTGHHIGAYATAFTYDFELGGRGQMAGKPGGSLWDRAHFAAGLEYGYSLPVARHLNIDFTIGIGYMGGTYYDYRPQDGHYIWQKTVNRHWFGPTKLQVSLVWLLGHGNYNASKGGGK